MVVYYLTIGAPRAGKSTYVSQLVCQKVSPDKIRDELGVTIQESYNIALMQIEKTLKKGEDVLLDATNQTEKKRRNMIAVGKPYASRIIGIWLNTPAELCIERHFQRMASGETSERYTKENQEPFEDIIRRYCEILEKEPPTLDEGFDEIIIIAPDSVKTITH